MRYRRKEIKVSTFQNCTIVSLPAGGDLDGNIYHALTLNSSGQVEEADATTEVVVGVLAEDPGTTAAGDAVAVMLTGAGGVGLVKAGAAIAAGAILVPTTTAGKVDDVANTAAIIDAQMGFGMALQSATAADQIIEFLAMPIAAGHTTA